MKRTKRDDRNTIAALGSDQYTRLTTETPPVDDDDFQQRTECPSCATAEERLREVHPLFRPLLTRRFGESAQ